MLTATLFLAIAAQDDWQALREASKAVELPAADIAALEAWRDNVRPAESERRWDEIPWVTTFSEGVRRADTEGKPLLFWAMNGHPLGCT